MLISRTVFARAFCVVFVCVAVFGGALSSAYSPYSNPIDEGVNTLGDGPELTFDPNLVDVLVYDSGTDGYIREALPELGIEEFTVRTAATNNHVTANDLATHDILIVSWNAAGDMGGLDAAVLESGITGRILLTGHDADYHTVRGTSHDPEEPADTFFLQAIDFVLAGQGTGLIALGDADTAFSYLPEAWGIGATSTAGEKITFFTPEGLASGVYDDLDPNDMSTWGTSWHTEFEEWGLGFASFELGGPAGNNVVTIAAAINPYGFIFEKTDDVGQGDCRSPGDEVTYTICWDNPTDWTFYNAQIIDRLPDGVTYPEGSWTFDPNMTPIPPDPGYNANTHIYVWQLADLLPDSTGCVELTVTVNEKAEPGMMLHNIADMAADDIRPARASADTPVCCWDTVDPNMIFVDIYATGNNNGVSWADAYTDMQRAIARAANSACQVGACTIYAAQGTYSPGDNTKDTFTLPPNISMYGGFKTGGSPFEQRNPHRYETTLTGYIGLDANNHIIRNETVVMMGHNALLDGFTVTEGALHGIYGKNVDFAIENCTITSNSKQGLYVENGNVVLRWCKINNNTENGIRHIGAGSILTLENSKIVENNENGVRLEYSTPTIKNCVISHNGFFGTGFDGMQIYLPSEIPVLYNNTIAYNANAGVSWVDDFGSGSDPNELDYPDIQNCILWYNNDGGEQLAGHEFTQYSCVFDPNDSDGTDYTLDGSGNFSGNPGFAYEYSEDPNVVLNVHLAYDSPCIDLGSPVLSYADQNDIDAEARVVGSYVDIGADEVYSCDDDLTEDDIYNPVDWTADGIVNFHEYGIFAQAWLSVDPNNPLCDPNNSGYVSDPNDPGYITEGDKLRFKAKCDLDDDLDVDMGDFALFCDEWLWMACWKQSQMDSSIMMMAMGGGESMVMTESYAMEPSTVVPQAAAKAIEGYEPPTLEQSAAAILDYVNRRIEENHPNTEALYHMKAFLEDTLKELRKDK